MDVHCESGCIQNCHSRRLFGNLLFLLCSLSFDPLKKPNWQLVNFQFHFLSVLSNAAIYLSNVSQWLWLLFFATHQDAKCVPLKGGFFSLFGKAAQSLPSLMVYQTVLDLALNRLACRQSACGGRATGHVVLRAKLGLSLTFHLSLPYQNQSLSSCALKFLRINQILQVSKSFTE